VIANEVIPRNDGAAEALLDGHPLLRLGVSLPI